MRQVVFRLRMHIPECDHFGQGQFYKNVRPVDENKSEPIGSLFLIL